MSEHLAEVWANISQSLNLAKKALQEAERAAIEIGEEGVAEEFLEARQQIEMWWGEAKDQRRAIESQ